MKVKEVGVGANLKVIPDGGKRGIQKGWRERILGADKALKKRIGMGLGGKSDWGYPGKAPKIPPEKAHGFAKPQKGGPPKILRGFKIPP